MLFTYLLKLRFQTLRPLLLSHDASSHSQQLFLERFALILQIGLQPGELRSIEPAEQNAGEVAHGIVILAHIAQFLQAADVPVATSQQTTQGPQGDRQLIREKHTWTITGDAILTD